VVNKDYENTRKRKIYLLSVGIFEETIHKTCQHVAQRLGLERLQVIVLESLILSLHTVVGVSHESYVLSESPHPPLYRNTPRHRISHCQLQVFWMKLWELSV